MERAGIAPRYRLDYPSHFSKPRYTPKYHYSGPPQPGPAMLRCCSVTPDHGTVTLPPSRSRHGADKCSISFGSVRVRTQDSSVPPNVTTGENGTRGNCTTLPVGLPVPFLQASLHAQVPLLRPPSTGSSHTQVLFCDSRSRDRHTIPPQVASPDAEVDGSIAATATDERSDPRTNVFQTMPNSFGLFREYSHDLPRIDPEEGVELEDLDSRADAFASNPEHDTNGPNVYSPFPNRSAYLIRQWYWNGATQKTQSDFNGLINNVILDRNFEPEDLRGVNWAKLDKTLSAGEGNENLMSLPFCADDGWREASVDIQVPLGKNLEPKTFSVNGLWYRPLESVIASAFSSSKSARFHYRPHKLLWRSPHTPDSPPVQIHGEVYTSSSFQQVYDDLQKLSTEPGCELPRDIAACMLYSDSTHLAEFGNATLWPAYLSFGNQSKYERARPSSFAHHHIAYFPKLPDEIQEFIQQHSGKEGTAQLLTHCRRELVHAIWKLILGPEFQTAYRHGIVVRCGDGVIRRLYPRFFTYSADYPEKVLLASIHDMGSCPCPRCLVPKAEIYRIGQECDVKLRRDEACVDNEERRRLVNSARQLIYDRGYSVNSKPVEDLLKPLSLVPTQNAFSECLSEFLPNYFDLFAPDLLHEWELGVFKQLVTHLIRILYAMKDGKVLEFNKRFRLVPVFGRDTIRSFASGNVSELKKMAARNYEDILQCIIPVFDRLLPSQHNEIVQDLLFLTATLHALHKLRMHTETTLAVTDEVFKEFGNALRKFKQVTCTDFDTRELPKEMSARQRRMARRQAAQVAATDQQCHGEAAAATVFNMNTYKGHALGDYLHFIRLIGTTDSFTTQLGEREHRCAKSRATRTSMRGIEKQLSQIERREANIRTLEESLRPKLLSSEFPLPLDGESDRMTTSTSPEEHYHIGKSTKSHVLLPVWLHTHRNDPALANFTTKLRAHLLARLDGEKVYADLDTELSAALASEDVQKISIRNDCIYSHQLMQVNYTTYDLRREQDVIHVGTDRCDILMLADRDDSNSDTHPYWYARVLGIYHADIIDLRNCSPSQIATPQRMDFLFVRWFGEDPNWKSGWEARRLDQVGFFPGNLPGAFGFVDPGTV
ncbi:hypothetical protein K474DRAFT_1635827, partial [Panus rudis PR-1116 ss-1]